MPLGELRLCGLIPWKASESAPYINIEPWVPFDGNTGNPNHSLHQKRDFMPRASYQRGSMHRLLAYVSPRGNGVP
jgi:hypothetical protein